MMRTMNRREAWNWGEVKCIFMEKSGLGRIINFVAFQWTLNQTVAKYQILIRSLKVAGFNVLIPMTMIVVSEVAL